MYRDEVEKMTIDKFCPLDDIQNSQNIPVLTVFDILVSDTQVQLKLGNILINEYIR